jgi:hypothetical protein
MTGKSVNIDNNGGEIEPLCNSIRSRVFALLNKNHELSPKKICALLDLRHVSSGHLIREYKRQWNCQHRSELRLNGLSFHRWHGWIYTPSFCNRKIAVGLSDSTNEWKKTKSKNRMIVFDARNVNLGRLEWFEEDKKLSFPNAGRVNIFVKTPGTPGKLKQLLSNAFYKTGLIFDIRFFDKWANSARMKGSTLAVNLGIPLPKFRIDFLKDAAGVSLIADGSDPNCVEIEYNYPDWAEKNERMAAKIEPLLEQNKILNRQVRTELRKNQQLLAENKDLLIQNAQLMKQNCESNMMVQNTLMEILALREQLRLNTRPFDSKHSPVPNGLYE